MKDLIYTTRNAAVINLVIMLVFGAQLILQHAQIKELLKDNVDLTQEYVNLMESSLEMSLPSGSIDILKENNMTEEDLK